MSKIKLLHIMDKVSVDGSKIHGPARQLAYRIPFYEQGCYEVRLLNLRKEDPACDVIRESGLEVTSLDRGKFDLRALGDIRRAIREFEPDLLHLHGYAAHSFGRVAGKLHRIPVVVQEHFVDERCPVYQRTADWVLRKAQAGGLAVSDAVTDFMVDVRFMPRNQIEVIGNGIPFDKLSARTDPASKRKEAGIAEDAFVIGTVGRLTEMKGQTYFLQAAAHLMKDQPEIPYHFVLVGDGPLAESLRQEAQELGIADRVTFPGYQEDVKSWIDLFQIGVVPSIFGEGFCSVGIEILGAGVPLVITDLPCFEGIYLADENVLQVPTRDVGALATAFQRIREDGEFRKGLIEQGIATGKKYDMANIAKQYQDYYAKILV